MVGAAAVGLPTPCGHSPGHQHVSRGLGDRVFQQPGLQVDTCRTPSPPSGQGGKWVPTHHHSALGGGVAGAGGCPSLKHPAVYRESGILGLPPRPKAVPCSGASEEAGHGAQGQLVVVSRVGSSPTCRLLSSEVHESSGEEVCLQGGQRGAQGPRGHFPGGLVGLHLEVTHQAPPTGAPGPSHWRSRRPRPARLAASAVRARPGRGTTGDPLGPALSPSRTGSLGSKRAGIFIAHPPCPVPASLRPRDEQGALRRRQLGLDPAPSRASVRPPGQSCTRRSAGRMARDHQP